MLRAVETQITPATRLRQRVEVALVESRHDRTPLRIELGALLVVARVAVEQACTRRRPGPRAVDNDAFLLQRRGLLAEAGAEVLAVADQQHCFAGRVALLEDAPRLGNAQ